MNLIPLLLVTILTAACASADERADARSGSQVDIDDLTTDLRNEFDDWLNGSTTRSVLADEGFEPSQIDWNTGLGWRIIERDEY